MTIKEKLDFLVDEYKKLIEFQNLCDNEQDGFDICELARCSGVHLYDCIYKAAEAVNAKIAVSGRDSSEYLFELSFIYREVKFFELQNSVCEED